MTRFLTAILLMLAVLLLFVEPVLKVPKQESRGRFRPCALCGRAPSAHNPHPLNDAYVGHEYR